MQGHTSQPATVERLGAAMRALRARLSFRRLRPPLRAASLIFTTGLLAFGIAILVSGLSTGLALQYGPNLRPLVLRVLLGLLVWDIGKVVGVALGAVLLARLAVLPARPSGIALTVCVYALDVGLAALLGQVRGGYTNPTVLLSRCAIAVLVAWMGVVLLRRLTPRFHPETPTPGTSARRPETAAPASATPARGPETPTPERQVPPSAVGGVGAAPTEPQPGEPPSQAPQAQREPSPQAPPETPPLSE